jgi:hypothetical protein
MYQLLAQECSSEALAIFAYTVYKQHKAESLRAILEKNGKEATQVELETFYRSWKGWAADVSGNLAVNFVTILVIAALLFGFRGLDNMLGEFGRNSGVLRK